MSIREGRGRHRRDYPSRSEEKPLHGRGNNPPSRHLWVGKLSHNLTESALARHFLQFGELESVAFQPGRSYAFINYRNEDDAFAAIRELQGFVIGGNPLRIEFTKAEKSSMPSRDAAYSERRDEPYSRARGSPFSQRDSRARHSSPELSHLNKSKVNDKDGEPSEVLWIGFPAQLKVDEFILRKAFSQFGEIEKITAFPGRTYAFIRFRNVMAACRAKETLHGKLFGNPRVHICFAKNDSGPSSRERNPINPPPSPPYGHAGSFEHLRSDGNFGNMSGDPSSRSPLISNLDRRESNVIGLSRKTSRWPGESDAHEQRRFPRHESELGLPGNIYDHPDTPPRSIGAHIREFSPPNFPRQGPICDDPWDLPEDVSLLHGTKKLKTNAYPPDNELPEYPFSDLEKAKRVLPRDIPQPVVLDKDYDSRLSGYRPIPDHLMNDTQPFGERGDHWNASHDDFQVGSVPMPPPDRRRLTPDLRESSSKEVWRWEGMIAKGGTSVCRARCFPVGKPPDMVLPEYLDCTARTSLEMLAKHYYQAASAWVVFFVPANDPDISYYNDFMSYLEERQRAAVAKLDERTTLFLVPPSEFSEKVLKVPGKLSISGVVLRLDAPGSSYGSLPQNESRETTFTSFQSDLPYQKPISPSGPYLPTPPFTNYEKPGTTVAPFPGNLSSTAQPQGQDYVRKAAAGPNWGPHDLQNSNSIVQNFTSQASNLSVGPVNHPYLGTARPMQDATLGNYTPDNSGIPFSGNGKFPVQEKPPIPSSTSVAGLPAEQLAQLASSLLGQQGQLGSTSSTGEYKTSANINQAGYSYNMSQNYGLPNDQVSSEFPQSQFGQLQQLQQQSPNVIVSQREVQAAAQMNQQFQNGGEDDPEADPQKRLQATLQLAAALLQQIQQGKGN
ncbi:Apoptosis-promoting RNA-binding protein TIA-1/TIAR (RRM superfamily) [Handroanthus impetiginosus]|uniref:Apoptosis-promoting RNA-binding protein TIA-1/TIAR (RRM superfamily) n=1 Tax=Handroanthus impetiginosus TaxID=429701 RepID=A0A2G9G6R6_9LAMI|nr:Apoptosis-promoting RNA-binding protein TIA-1/TIAR (RRM superfamily) [Handroanthus impetiginosus]